MVVRLFRKNDTIVKEMFEKTIVGQSKLTNKELLRELTEVEMILNSRPLTHISPDDLDGDAC